MSHGTYALNQIACVRKDKYKPRAGEELACIELEHIEKGSGRILGNAAVNMNSCTKNMFFKGDVLFGKLRPNLRKFAYPCYDGLCSSEIWVLKPNTDLVLGKFLFYLVQSQRFIREACKTVGTKMPRADWFVLEDFKFNIPPKDRQEESVYILQTWDTAIEKTEALIAVKEKRFKWLTKTLISDPFDSPNWTRLTLGEVGKISSAGVDKKIVAGEQEVRLVNYLDVYHLDAIYSNQLNHRVTAPANKAKECAVRKGDIFFTPSSEIRGDIGNSAVAMENIPDAVYSYHIVRLRPQIEIDTLYSCYAFKSHAFYKQVVRFAAGSGQRYVVSQDNFRKTVVSIPSISEQRRIARTLNTAQREIALLRQLVDCYREQKRSLMQKLLTGQWRI